ALPDTSSPWTPVHCTKGQKNCPEGQYRRALLGGYSVVHSPVGQVSGRGKMPSERPRIGVGEDDASMSQAIERVLQAGGFAAVLFASAEAALDADAAAADGLVLDIHLPGMSGFELYRRLAVDRALTVLFVTARDEPAVREEAEGLG